MLEPEYIHRHFPVNTVIVCLLLAGISFINACTVAVPQITSVNPTTIGYGKAATVNITADALKPDTDVILAPGGPFASDYFALANIRQLKTTGDLIIAIDATGSLQLLRLNDKGFTWLSGLSLDGAIEHIALDASQLFLIEKGVGLKQFDISNPKKPVLLNQRLFSHAVRNIAVDATAIYLVTEDQQNSSKQQLHRIHRAVWPNQKIPDSNSVIDLPWPIHDLLVADKRCYLLGPNHGLVIFDCGDDKPTLLDQFATTGSAQRITLQQPLAYIADGDAGVVVLDVSDPRNIQWLGSHNKLGYVDNLVLHNNTAIVSNVLDDHDVKNRMEIRRLVSLNISKPSLPITGSFFKLKQAVRDFGLFDTTPQSLVQASSNSDDGITIIAATDEGLYRIDYSIPAKIQISNEGINLGGSRRGFIKDNIAYVADWFSGLHMYDISTPATPKHIGNYHTPGSSKGVVVKDHYAFVGDDDHGLQIIDVADPAHPQHVAEMSLTGLAYTLKLVDNLLYVADHRGGFHIIDISDIRQPNHLSNIDTPGKSWAIDVVGNIAYVADDSDGLLIFDISDKLKPRLLSQFNPRGYAEDVLVKNGLAYVSFFDEGLHIVDVSDPAHPQALSHLRIPGNARSIKLEGNYAYMAGWESGLQIVDVHDPRQPVISGYYDTDGSAWGADIYEGHAYVWDWWGGVKVIDISNPHQPMLAGRYQGRDDIEAFRQKDHYIYCANGFSGVQIFDINNPLNPIWVTGVDTSSSVHDVWLDQSLAYTASESGIDIIDVSNPFQAQLLTHVNTRYPLRHISVSQTNVFAVDLQGKLLQFANRAPAQLESLRTYPLKATGLWQSDDWIYVTTEQQGLLAFVLNPNDGGLREQARYPVAVNGIVTAHNNLIAVVESGVGIHLLQHSEKSPHTFTRLALIDIPQSVTDVAINDAGLDVYSPAMGLMHYNIEANMRPRLTAIYPDTGRHQKFLIQDEDAFFAGEPTIASVRLIPDIKISQSGPQSLALELPRHLPRGPYHVGLQNTVNTDWKYNAFSVDLVKPRTPKFTLEDFNKILQQQK